MLIEEYEMDEEDLRLKWDEARKGLVDDPPKCQKGTCPYQYSRGPKRGTICGARLRGSNAYCSKHRPPVEQKKKGLVFRRHRQFNHLLWHPATGFVMRNKKEGIIGKIVEKREGESKVDTELSAADIKKCKELNLPYCHIEDLNLDPEC